MMKIHNNLAQRSKLYQRWHQHRYHQHHHWLVFGLVYIISSFAIFGAWSLNINEANQLALSFELPQVQAQNCIPRGGRGRDCLTFKERAAAKLTATPAPKASDSVSERRAFIRPFS